MDKRKNGTLPSHYLILYHYRLNPAVNTSMQERPFRACLAVNSMHKIARLLSWIAYDVHAYPLTNMQTTAIYHTYVPNITFWEELPLTKDAML